MRILFIGDIMGRSGREALEKHLPDLKAKLRPDVVIVNGENAAHGIGITKQICGQIYDSGADCITTGNHIWDQRDIIQYIGNDPKLLRPLNYPKGTPGNGHYLHQLPDGRSVLIVNLMGRVFMDALDDPFAQADSLLNKFPLAKTAGHIFIDFHAEATSEKMAFAHFIDGRVSAVVGTHTHIPTADCQILQGGTAYQSDAGMTGDYNSVIGVKADVPIMKFTRKMPTDRMSPASGQATLCGTFIMTDDKTGLAESIEPVRLGPRLSNHMPESP